MKYCNFCGAEMHDDASLCLKCGCFVDKLKEDKPETKDKKKYLLSDGLAIAMFVLTLCLGFLFTMPCSIIALDMREHISKKARGFHIATVVISALCWLPFIIGYFLFLTQI